MARGGAKRKRVRIAEEVIDATPERLAKGDESVFIDPAKIDSSEQRIGYVRQFRKESRLDQWHRREIITHRQFIAGHEYRSLHMRAIATPRVVAAYGERTTGGESDYGMARTDAQARARSKWRAARDAIPREMVAFLDKLLIHDSLPHYRGRAQMRSFADCRKALDELALHFERRY
jgi:hypothetical protein